MAVPTFVSVSPSSGSAGGGTIVTITGTNFNVPAELTDNWTSVGVEFGGIVSERVDVLSSTSLRVWTPPYQGTAAAFDQNPIDPVDIRIYNIDEDGDAISGETVTAADKYTYTRSEIRAPRATYSNQIYKQVLANTVWYFGRQVVPKVSIGTSVDYGESGSTEPKVADLPSIALVGPRIEEDIVNRHRWAEPEIVDEDKLYPPSFVCNFEMDAVLMSNSKMELYGMIQGLHAMFMRTPYLKVPEDPTSPNDGYYTFPFILTDQPFVTDADPNSDLVTATATFQIRHIPFRLDDYETLDEVLSYYVQVFGSAEYTEGDTYEMISSVVGIPVQEIHVVTQGEYDVGYFELTYDPASASTVNMSIVGGVRQVNKNALGRGSVTPDFDVLNTNEIHINNTGEATGLSEGIDVGDTLAIDYYRD